MKNYLSSLEDEVFPRCNSDLHFPSPMLLLNCHQIAIALLRNDAHELISEIRYGHYKGRIQSMFAGRESKIYVVRHFFGRNIF